MTHRERVVAALDHQEPDRIPMDFGSARTTTIVLPGYECLKKYLGVEGESIIIDRMMQVVKVDEEVQRKFDVDFRGIFLGRPDKGGDVELEPNRYRDEWGVVRVKPRGSFYYDLEKSPLAGEITVEDIVRYPWPDPHDPGRFRNLREQVEKLHRETDYALVLNLPSVFVHVSQYLRGFEDWFADCALNPSLLGALFDAILEVNLAICEEALAQVGGLIDIVATSDDLGMQNGPIVSPELYRKLFKPRHRRYFQLIHERTKAKIYFHTCGSVWAILDDLVEIGIDILNPVQVSAANMDTARLKEKYGRVLSFWGAIDTQYVLPHGSVEEVRAEVRRRINDLAPGGGYVLSAVHNIQPDVPSENIVAMYYFAREYGRYPQHKSEDL